MAVLQKKAPDESDVSIVIPTYKRPGLAVKAAKKIRQFHPGVEIIIVDQESTSAISKKEQGTLKIAYFNLSKANTSSAKNKGIEESKGEIIFFFDDDIEITKNTIPAQLAQYSDETVVGTSGRVINDGEKTPKKSAVETGKTNRMGTKFLLQYWSTKKQAIDFPYGCNMSFRKSTLKAAGGFDERFPKIFEEVDLGVRVSRMYGSILFVPGALAFHHKAPAGGTRTDIRNKKRMIYLHYGKYLGKDVPFPLSLVSLGMRTKTALFEAPYALVDLYNGYIETLL